MKALLEEYGDIVLSIICGLLGISIFFAFIHISLGNNHSLYQKAEPVLIIDSYDPAEIALFEAGDQYFPQGSPFVMADWVIAKNNYGEDLLAYVTCDRVFDTQICGTYELIYSIYYRGEYQCKQVTYYVL